MRNPKGEQMNDKHGIDMDKVNRIFQEAIGDLLPRQPRYRYWQDEKKNRYCYTIEKMRDHKTGKDRYVSYRYRYYKTRNQWVLKDKLYHNKKKDAKARAYRLYQQHKGAKQ